MFAEGARTAASDALQFVYDNRAQLQLERAVNPLVATRTVLDHDYDLNGLPTALATNLGGMISGTTISGGIKDLVNQYVRDALGRLTSVTQRSGSSPSVRCFRPRTRPDSHVRRISHPEQCARV